MRVGVESERLVPGTEIRIVKIHDERFSLCSSCVVRPLPWRCRQAGAVQELSPWTGRGRTAGGRKADFIIRDAALEITGQGPGRFVSALALLQADDLRV